MATLNQHHGHWVLPSVEGWSEAASSNPNEMVVEVVRAMMARANKGVVPADTGQPGVRSTCWLGPRDNVDLLVSDAHRSTAALRERLSAAGVEVAWK